MRVKIINAVLLLCLGFGAFAQSDKVGLTDDLVQNKGARMKAYIPMLPDETFLYSVFSMSPNEFIEKIDAFQASFKKEIEAEHDEKLRAIKNKDIYYYKINALSHFTGLHGMDSLGMLNLKKVIAEKKGDPNFTLLLKEAQEKAFQNKLSAEEKKRLLDLFMKDPDVNNEALFKRSAAYRTWLDTYILRVRQSTYKADTTLGYFGNDIVKLKVVNNEISNPFIKEYFNYKLTKSIISGGLKEASAKEEAYNKFMAMATIPQYKAEVKEVFDNFKNMTSSTLAPNFSYLDVNGKKVSLKDLRGKYVYIDVWATWCAPCKAEIPFLTKMEEDYQGKNIQFVSLSVDRAKDKEKWKKFVMDKKLKGIQLITDKDFSSDFILKFNIVSIPRFILIGPKGNIIDHDAKRPSEPELRVQLDGLLK